MPVKNLTFYLRVNERDAWVRHYENCVTSMLFSTTSGSILTEMLNNFDDDITVYAVTEGSATAKKRSITPGYYSFTVPVNSLDKSLLDVIEEVNPRLYKDILLG